MNRRALLLLPLGLAVTLSVRAPRAQAQPATRRIRGTITAIDQSSVSIRGRDGQIVTVALAPNLRIGAVVKRDLSAIKPGTFVGIAASGPDSGLSALEVTVFPEALRGTGEGHREWDLTPQSTMTNGNIDAIVTGSNGPVLTVKASGQTHQITVGPDTPIVSLEPGTREMLVVGAKVFITAMVGANGALSTERLTVGKDGLTPPM